MQFDESIRIRRPEHDVFAMLADIQRYATSPGSPVVAMDKIPPGPTVVGTRWREVVRLLGPVTMTMWSEATTVEPDSRLGLRFWGGGMEGTLVYTLTAEGPDTVLRHQESLAAVGPLRPLSGIMGAMLSPRLHRRLRALRAELEQNLMQ
jgi:carbon monoxide dehydrogenase subunit G